jgi:DNA processing protein
MGTPSSLYIHGFNLMPQFGPVRLLKLHRHFENWQQAFLASASELTEAGIEADIATAFVQHRASISLAQQAESLAENNIQLLTFTDVNYPKLLLEIEKFPPLLYYKGQMENNEELCLAVVGTRMITGYGRIVTPKLIEPLVDAGATIVSGMAFGVDSAAHTIATSKGKRTVAVLGGGLDEKSLYPKAHALLAQNILDCGGALLSEYPPGTPNFKQNFVARNRIISGMSVATVVVECDLKSGSLITAKYALEQNRSVYAVPGPIYSPQSQGPNNLIKMGAKLITEAKDILEDLNLQALPEQQEAQILFGDSPTENVILGVIAYEPIHINDIVKQSRLETGDVASALTFLEMKGKVRNLGGQQYILSR